MWVREGRRVCVLLRHSCTHIVPPATSDNHEARNDDSLSDGWMERIGDIHLMSSHVKLHFKTNIYSFACCFSLRAAIEFCQICSVFSQLCFEEWRVDQPIRGEMGRTAKVWLSNQNSFTLMFCLNLYLLKAPVDFYNWNKHFCKKRSIIIQRSELFFILFQHI